MKNIEGETSVEKKKTLSDCMKLYDIYVEVTDILVTLERIKGLLVLTANYETGKNGFDSNAYHGIGAALSLINSAIKSTDKVKNNLVACSQLEEKKQ